MNRIKNVLLSIMVLCAAAPSSAAESSELTSKAIESFVTATKISMVYEYGALLYLSKGVIEITPLRTDNDPVAVMLPSVLNIPHGAMVMGVLHTHPCVVDYDTYRLSDIDINTAKWHGRPSYILDLCTGDVHVWNPMYDSEKRPSGRIVGHIQLPAKLRIVIPTVLPTLTITAKPIG